MSKRNNPSSKRTGKAKSSGAIKLARPSIAANPPPPAESRAAEALTIGWMLSMMATMVSLLVYAIVRVAIAVSGVAEAENAEASLFYADLLLFTAMTVGVFSLLLVPVVLRIRRQKPPRGVTRVAVAVGLLPILLVIARAFVR